jgi:hypothetical protein
MKFSMTGQEKGDLLIQVTAWAGGLGIKKSAGLFKGVLQFITF